jgi:hypothetical protein
MRYAWDQFDAYFGPGADGASPAHCSTGPCWRGSRVGPGTGRHACTASSPTPRTLRGGSADTIIASRPSCIRRSTRPSSTPPTSHRAATFCRVGARAVQADRGGDRRVRALGAPLRIVGDGPGAPRLERARGRRTWRFTGPAQRRGRARLYRRALAVLLPGRGGLRHRAVEAQACGRPVVALARGGALETVVDGETGVLFDEPDAGLAGARSSARPAVGSTRPGSARTRSGSAATLRERRCASDRRDMPRARHRDGKTLQPPPRRLLRRDRRLCSAMWAFVLAYGIRFESGPDPRHEGATRRSSSTSTSCPSSPSSRRSPSTSGRLPAAARPLAGRRLLRRPRRQRSSPSSSASSRRCTCRRTTPRTNEGASARTRCRSSSGRSSSAQRRLHVRVARGRPRAARAPLARGHRPEAHLIAGAGDLGRMVADRVLEHRELGYQLVGFVDDRGRRRPHRLPRPPAPRHARGHGARDRQREHVDHLYVALAARGALQDARPRRVHQPRVHRRQGRAGPAAVHRAARAARGSRRPADHQRQRRAAAGLQRVASSAAVDVVLSAAALAVLAVPLADHRAAHQAQSPGPVFYTQERMGLDGKAFTVYKFRSMPIGAEDTPARSGRATTTRARRRSGAGCAATTRRAAAVLERPEGRHVDRRAAARAPVLRRAVQAPHPAVHAAAQGQGRHHRLGAGQRLARQHLAREAHRVRPVLHRELVGVARPQDHVADARRGACSSAAPPESLSRRPD